ncbi:hypothetical protein ACFWBB_38860 [Streptomyces sp. NPDC060000]|uniref:hypothetical protein n=1 Tax=Streptomyces sp. NPDC060000 TaxID=3347031 RepID=UPI00369E9E18
MRVQTTFVVAAAVPVTVAAAAAVLEAGRWRLYADRHRIELKPRPRRSCPDCRGAGGWWVGGPKTTIANTWPASQVLSLDALRETVSDDFSVKFSVLKELALHSRRMGWVAECCPGRAERFKRIHEMSADRDGPFFAEDLEKLTRRYQQRARSRSAVSLPARGLAKMRAKGAIS